MLPRVVFKVPMPFVIEREKRLKKVGKSNKVPKIDFTCDKKFRGYHMINGFR